MTNDHWFDRLNKALVRSEPRRTLLQAASAVAAAHLFGEASETEAAKNRNKNKQKNRNRNRNRNKNKKRRRKPNPKPKPTCSRGACRREWPRDTEHDRNEREYCEFICRQCDGADPREFCLLDGFTDDGSKVAFCCDEGTECCGNTCCGFEDEQWKFRCCNGECLNVNTNDDHCGRCNRSCDGPCEECRDGQCFNVCQLIPGTTCCDGRCVNLDTADPHCGACNHACDPSIGEKCCDGSCVNIRTDPEYCGGCNAIPCWAGAGCCNSICYDPATHVCLDVGPRPRP
jgi:hypothetical protein